MLDRPASMPGGGRLEERATAPRTAQRWRSAHVHPSDRAYGKELDPLDRSVTMLRLVVVGAGISGLAAASALAADGAAVTVVERLPAVGGTRHYDHPDVQSLERECAQRGVAMRLGATALRWQDCRLLVAAPGSIEWLEADHLVFAGGCRPATQVEMRIMGSRLAGVMSATIAVHLAEAGARLGRKPVLVGVSDWAERVAVHLRATNVPIAVVSAEDAERPSYADEFWPQWTAEQVLGAGRVEELRIARGDDRRRVLCDAVILADQIRPLRNVEGAVFGGEHVTFAQLPAAHVTPAEVAANARAAVLSVEQMFGRSWS